MNEISIQVFANRKLSKKTVDIGNMQENKVTKLIFELDEDIVALGGNVYLVVSYDGSSYPYPLTDNTIEIGRELTQRKKTEANIMVSTSDEAENLFDDAVWISNTLMLLTDKNSINVAAINETELPPSLQIVYERLLALEKDLQEKKENDYWRGRDGIDGKSAYQYAVEGGYKGTEAEFTENLAKELVDESQLVKFAIKQTTEKATFHHITDSANYKVLDFGLEGKTEQNTVPGNQFFDISKVSDFSGSTHSITNNGDGTLTIYSNLAANNSYSTDKLKDFAPNLVVGETYTLNATTTGSMKTIYLIGAKVTWKFGNSLEITQDILDSTVAWYTDTDADITTAIISDIMINHGTTALPWEPYVGGSPSPNPEYPQEIINAGVYNEETGRYEIGCRFVGKNLLDLPAKVAQDSNYYSLNEDGSVNLLGNDGRAWGQIEPTMYLEAGTYYIKMFTEGCRMGVFVSYGGNAYAVGYGETTKLTVISYSAIKIKIYDTSYVAHNNVECGIYQEDYDEFIPFVSWEVRLTSPVPITKWDYMTKRDGVWGFNYKSMVQKYTGTTGETWYKWGSGYAMYLPDAVAPKSNIITIDALCNIHSVGKYNDIMNGTEGFGIGTYNGQSIVVLYSELSTLEEWLEYITANPIVLAYETIEEKFVTLPDEEQEMLRKTETYYGGTNITNDQNCPMWLQYVADTKLYVDNQILDIKKAIV